MTTAATHGERITGLRVVHAAVFLLICAASIAVGLEEVRQLFFVLSQPFHFGEPPRVAPLLGVLLGAGAALGILVLFVAGKSVPLWLSAVVCISLGIGFFGQLGEGTARRAHHAANLDVLAAGRQLHRLQTEALQTTGEIDPGVSAWFAALAKLQLPLSPARTRAFEQLPFELQLLPAKDAPLAGLRPGTLAVWTSADGVEFSIFPIGFDERGIPSQLFDQTGRPVELTGAFNPNVKEPRLPPSNPLVPTQ